MTEVRKAINHREWMVEYMTLEMIKQKVVKERMIHVYGNV